MKDFFKMNREFKKYLPIFMIMLSIVLLMGTSYALLRSSQQGENTYVMNVGLLEVTFQDAETNAFSFDNMIPMSDEDGMKIEEELEFTVKNTGTLSAKYNVYIEETSTSPAFKTVIRFISNKNDEGYNSPKTLSEDYYIDAMSSLDVGETATYKVKVWLDESADSTYMDKTFTARVVVDVMQGNAPARSLIDNSIKNSTCNPSITDTDGTIYLSGTNDCVNFNYVWYSGKLWRITALYPDGTMKMITDSAITAIAYGSDYNFYTDEENTSYMYQWLNEDFLDTLYNYENIIVTDAIWNASPGNGTISSKLPIDGQEEVLVTSPVGLLNSYECYKSYQNTSYGSGYLNIGYYWWLLNRYSTSSSYVWRLDHAGSGSNDSPGNTLGGRPVVNLKSGVQLEGGSGTASNPYRIKGDKEDAVSGVTLINTRTSGEYVKFNEELYRIVGIENETTKLIKADYVKDGTTILTKKFASSATFGSSIETGSDDYWDYYLNNTWLKLVDSTYDETEGTSSVLAKGTYYIKSFTGGNYKGTACTTVSNTTTIEKCDKTGIATWTGFVGLPRYGEMFASQPSDYTYINAKYLWLITPYSSSNVWYVGDYIFDGNRSPGYAHGGRPTIHLTSSVVIKSGSGTKQDPFVVGLPS